MEPIRNDPVPDDLRPAPHSHWKAFTSRWRRAVVVPRSDSRTAAAASRHARDLALLLDASNTLASTSNLDDLLQALCQEMAGLVDSTYCRILLMDEAESQLTIRGFCAIRELEWKPVLGRTFPKTLLPRHTQALVQGEPLVITRDSPETPVQDPEGSLLFLPGTRSVLLMPLMAKGRCLGVAALGEMRSLKRTRFTEEKIELCRAVAQQGALAIENFRAFDSIAHQNREIQLILDNVTDGVFRTDASGRILAFNPAAERMTGFPAGEVIGHECAGTFKGQDGDGCALCGTGCPVRQILRSTDNFEPVEVKEIITRYDGTTMPIVHSVAPVLDPQRQIIGTVSVIRDVSREDELLRMKSEFISLVSHQLRAPLATMSAAVGLLLDADLDEATRMEMLQTLDERCDSLSQLVNHFLESARLEKGQFGLSLEPLALAPLIDETIRTYGFGSDPREIQIHAPSTLPFVLGDRTSVMVIIQNLLRNAVKYSPPASPIDFSAEEEGAGVRVSVTDHGPGISPDQLNSIFRPFHRGIHEADHSVPGFGLGLHIARMLVEAQGGKIWAESETGRGACFRFTLQKL
jgi:PAS domain S-box-containing protein